MKKMSVKTPVTSFLYISSIMIICLLNKTVHIRNEMTVVVLDRTVHESILSAIQVVHLCYWWSVQKQLCD